MPWIKKGQAHCSGNTESYNQAKYSPVCVATSKLSKFRREMVNCRYKVQ